MSKQFDVQSLDFSLVITEALLDKDANGGSGEVHIKFQSGRTLVLLDVGQSCCEHRYLHTDDNLADLIGQTLTSVHVLSTERGGDAEREDCSDIAFLQIVTDRGRVVVETHNEHNGYYGGFSLRAEIHDADDTLISKSDLET
jgi:hypothetical protein